MYVRPIKYHSGYEPEELKLEYENVSFKTKDGLTLRGWFIPSNHSNATIIIGHGFPFDKKNILPVTMFLKEHFNLFYYDFRYFGNSDGKYTTLGYKERDDFLMAVKYVKSRQDVDSGKIGALGFSLSAATFLMAESRDVNAIVADSSYSNFERLSKRVFFIFPSFTKYPFIWMTSLYAKLFLGIDTFELNPSESVSRLDVPILFIHGTEDSQISVENSKILHLNARNSELWLVEGAEHGESASIDRKKYEDRIMKFFDKNLLD